MDTSQRHRVADVFITDVAKVEPSIHDSLFVPLHADRRPVGTLWTNAHDQARTFDAQDVRLLQSLRRFASIDF